MGFGQDIEEGLSHADRQTGQPSRRTPVHDMIKSSSERRINPYSSTTVTRLPLLTMRVIHVLFDPLHQPVGHHLGNILVVFLQHHHMSVAPYAHVLQFDEIDVYPRLSEKPY